ncbi:NYN domain-containing protein [Collinsella intestinalis]|uniref:NYN domain-containing protein n=1 Tax=Collinsella intestinalis TaxID=147207 RepID=UPI00195A507C|nr:NYN domain-containing protein [Collinsella intestinalis]MBM6908600.1 NYN domain-containing protein [Collinsella intestinalis]
MSKKNRAKAKAKRFGEGSAKPIVSASTFGVGNAFSAAFGEVAEPARGTNARGQKELLVVDGYNVIHADPRYERLIFDRSDDPYSRDVYDAARTSLIADVAAFSQGRYEPVIVFDGAGNVNPDRPNLPQAGVRIEFSPTGVSADTVIQRLCTDAREHGRACSVVTSDGTIQATVMGKGVTRISARMFAGEVKQVDADVAEAEAAPDIKLTLGSRLGGDSLSKLAALRDSLRS